MGILSALFGGSSSKSSSSNVNNSLLTGAMNPYISAGSGANSAITSALGGDASGFNAFKNAAGFDWLLKEGLTNVSAPAAARGLLRSGGTAKALSNYSQGMANQYFQSYLDTLLKQAGLGIQAGGVLSDSGKVSSSSGSSDSGGLGKAIGFGLSLLGMSDRRTKENIEMAGMLDNGLGIYEYNYIGDPTRWVGVMADEVERLQPDALGPVINGFRTVNYSRLEGNLSNGPIRITA